MAADTREQKLLRALIVDPGDRDGHRLDLVLANHAAFAARPIAWEVAEDRRIYALVRAHLDQHGEPPDITAVQSLVRGQASAGDLLDRLERVLMVREFVVRSSFEVLLDELHDEHRAAATVELAKRVVEITLRGLDVGEGRDARKIRGADDALDHVIAEATKLRATAPSQSIFECASAVREEDQEWLWNGYLPLGELVLLEGPSHAGKSTMLGALVAIITRGLSMPGEVAGQAAGDVVWISTEERSSTQLVPRLRIAGADLDRVHLVQMDKSWSTAAMRELIALVESQKPRLIVIDALKDTLGKYKDSDELEVRRALRPLVELGHRYGICVVGVRHWRKSAGFARDRGAGSMGYGALARGILVVGELDDARHVAVAKCPGLPGTTWSFRIEPVVEAGRQSPIPRVTWVGPSPDVTADNLAAAQPESADEATAKGEAVEFLVRVLANGPLPSAEVFRFADREGIARATLRRARKVCCKPGSGGPQSLWELRDPPAPKPAPTNAINLDDDPPAAPRATTTPPPAPTTRPPTIRELLARVQPPQIEIVKGKPAKVPMESMRSRRGPVLVEYEIVEVPRADGRLAQLFVGPWEPHPDGAIADVVGLDDDVVPDDAGGVVRSSQGYGLSEWMLRELGHAVA